MSPFLPDDFKSTLDSLFADRLSPKSEAWLRCGLNSGEDPGALPDDLRPNACLEDGETVATLLLKKLAHEESAKTGGTNHTRGKALVSEATKRQGHALRVWDELLERERKKYGFGEPAALTEADLTRKFVANAKGETPQDLRTRYLMQQAKNSGFSQTGPNRKDGPSVSFAA